MRLCGAIVVLLAISCSETKGPQQPVARDEQEDTVVRNNDTTLSMDGELTYLALGDSYTIGESVPETERWPVQLVERLDGDLESELSEPKIIARTGWTTNELQNGINDAEINPPYDLVSLLIGVNNQYRGYPIEQYQKEFSELLEQAISFAGHDRERVFVVSIPDYGVTPFTEKQGLDKEKIAQEIDLYNDIAKNIAEEYQVRYFDITPISRKAENDPELIAEDGLHPSGKMYAEWVSLMLPHVLQILDE